MSCQICVEVCPFDAIKMDVEFELARRIGSVNCCSRRRSSRSPTAYYHKIHPAEAAEVDGRLAVEKAKAEAKARADAETKAKAAAARPAPTLA